MTEQLIIDGPRVPASDSGTFESSIRRQARCWRRSSKATKADVDRAVRSAQAAFEGKAWGGDRTGRARPHHAAHRAGTARPGRRARDAREPRQRQAAETGADRRAGGGALLRVLRGHRRQDHGQHDPARARVPRLHDPRANRRVGADRSVELSDSDRRARRRAGARGRMHGRAQAVERSADDGAAPRRDRAHVRPAARRAQRRPRLWRRSRRRAGEPSAHQSADIHRIG